jgi:cilia- and flagella-associated protein 251
VVSGTTDGFIVVWDISLIMENYSKPEERRNIKSVNLINTGSKMGSNKKESTSINILKI